MKAIPKLISAIAAVSLLTSYFIVPTVHGESHDESAINKLQAVNELTENNTEAVAVPASSSSEQTIPEAVTYKQQIDMFRMHEYQFTTNGGVFTVKTNHQATDELSYLIYNRATEEIADETSPDTYTLTAGTYGFVVISENAQTKEYDFSLNGTFSQAPDTTLPGLEITAPAKQETRLSKGASPKLQVAGTTNASSVMLYDNNGEHSLTVNEGKFDHEADLTKGYNDITLYASNQAGNSVITNYFITLPGISRIDGKDRYAVSSKISSELQGLGQMSGTVIIARGDMFPDALAGGPLASAEEAPILLTQTKTLPETVKNEISALEAERAIILGGTGSVSTAVEAELEKLGVTEIERIGGRDRFEVAAGVAEQVSDNMGSDTAIIASGEVFPDALSASGIAGLEGMPILPVKSGSIPDSIQAFIKSHPEIENFIVVGGPATVKDSVLKKLGEISKGSHIERISGKDRYEVAINVAEYGIENFGMDLGMVTFARGDLFPDALSGAPLANYFGAPILLTTTNKLEGKVQAYLMDNTDETDHMYIFGGTGSVSEGTERQLFDLLP
ncbi:cell wall-binding repeat-containing protein [Bacillus sp. CECT 9360]|uniref:cell wall-binding repeat-containing protein n=1 Tax=Bacillus sp. CECT 9360 TaxID=2845821 RepID=UPI001E3FBB43|nr:cell wall-binding repeat-containing protein [Bacillus sp. CECT 9360]CAH0345160.1 hypothetical protein BCI9360_01439 [Bacillus sp. CECT 9360]